jgi:hypothetical protein
MGSTDALMAIGLLVVFLGGVMAGIIVIVSAAYRREDRHYSLDGMAPDAACRATRRLTGAWVRGHGFKPLSWYEPGANPSGNAWKQEARQ